MGLIDMQFLRKKYLLILLGMSAWLVSSAEVSRDVDHFFNEVATYTARFDQIVLDEGFNPIEESSGRMMIMRPGRFRWDYEPPNEQKIISDGERVTLYDVELEQITIRSLAGTVGDTPAGLLAGGTDINSEFEVIDLGVVNGPLHWVRMIPREQEDDGFEDIRVGFENGSLRVMELVDGLGQITRITLTDSVENAKISEAHFQFDPPEGVDVIDETR